MSNHTSVELHTDFLGVINKFETLVSTTMVSLKERKLSAVEIRKQAFGVRSIESVLHDVDPVSVQNHLWILRLIDTDEIYKMMENVVMYCSFMTFPMLELIIKNIGTPQDITNLLEYRGELDRYSSQCTLECPLEVRFREIDERNHAKMFISMNDTYRKSTLEELIKFVQKSHVILQSFVIKLCRFEFNQETCLITFQVPFQILQHIFPLSNEQEKALAHLGVDKLWFVYQFNKGES